MSIKRKKSRAATTALADAARLAERATHQPGVAELVKLYERHAETTRQAGAYLQPRNRLVIYSTSDATA